MCLKFFDVFCGIIIVSMIIVNNLGSWNYVYLFLFYVKWYGCIFIDLIFFFFLFIMGVVMIFFLLKYIDKN